VHSAPEQHRFEIRLLGPLEAVVDGRSVALGGPQARALLSLLAMSVGTAVSLDRLIGGVWSEDDQPAGAANTVQVYVSRLRRALAPDGGTPVIRSAAGGYLLDLPAEAVDLQRFERLAALGHDQLGRGDLGAAEQTLASAVAIWRGPALPDLDGDTVTALRARLDQRLVTAQADHADAQIALGHSEQAVAELEPLVQLHPLDEGLVVRLMTALYHSGRQADALAAYGTATAQLADELGVDPGAQLRQVHEAVLRQTLEAAPADPPATAPATAPATGRAPSARAGATSRSRERLRSPRGELVGRRTEIQQVLDLLADPAIRVVTILGPGGIGKTRLALAVADELTRPTIENGAGAGIQSGIAPRGVTARTAIVPLAAVADEGELLASIVQALGAEPEWPGQDLVELLIEELAEQRVVLVLDNLEQLVSGPASIEVLVELLDRLPELSLVLTSRIALRLYDEHQLPLGPLGLPDPHESDPEQVRASESVQLFLERARAVAPDFRVTADNAEAVAELCRMLDGQPLALELAAARIRVLLPRDMVQRTGKLLQLLTGGGRDLPDRQRSMRAALDGSAQLLDEVEASVFAQLSVFVGGWTLAAAEQVCESPEDVVDILTRLVDRSLVVADGSGRLAMLETVREYAAERLADAGDGLAATVRRQHTQYFAELAGEVGGRFMVSPDSDTREQLDAEAGNLTAALGHAAADGDDTCFGQLVVGTLTYWFYTGRMAQGERWLALSDTSQLPADLRARVLRVIGNVALVKGELAQAVGPLDGAVAAAREVGEPLLLAKALSIRGLAFHHSGKMTRALGYLDEAVQLVQGALAADPGSADLGRLVAALQNERGELLDNLGSVAEARSLFEAYRQQATLDDDHSHLAWALINLALSACDRGQDALARELVGGALRAADEGGSTPIQGDARMAAGLVEVLIGDPAVAVPLEAEAARMLQSSGLLLTLPDTISLLGAALLMVGQPADAARMLGAGAAWRADRGLVVVSRITQRAIARAEADLAAVRAQAGRSELGAAIDEEAARGAVAPFGWIEALDLPQAGQPVAAQIHLVDLSQRTAGAATSS
jgi:predicted ATPase/DNA-binding SARP family transcriptional activator